VNSAKRAEGRLGNVPEGKAVAATPGGERTLSGWTNESGYLDASKATDEVMKLSQDMGYSPKAGGFLDQGTKGKHFSSHAEKQMAALKPGEPIAVSRPMCDDCVPWFQKLAQYRQQSQVVADPKVVRVFRADGAVIEIPR
jgi:hypothetical protein